MRFIADLHIHSRYSRATSKASHIASLAAWARIKGVHVLGTGDFTHPGWFQELKETLSPAENGFFRLKESCKRDFSSLLRPDVAAEPIPTRFVLTAEISSIYKRGGKVRKVHNILFVPDFASAERINATLAAIGNIESDGRPILGLDSRDLLEILLEKAPGGFLVPAHIWTPWFSLFGSKSGFDRLEDCFGDLSHHIFALETGLSSDPEMNRLVSALDRYTLISNSDCHSPSKLCREANIFETEFDYYSMKKAIENPCDTTGNQRFVATVEFYPEEGKYHHDGHRKCSYCCDPYTSRELSEICPECGKPMTIGVLSRVIDLADRKTPLFPEGSPDVYSLIPLAEILSEIVGVGPNSKTVMFQYLKCIERFGSELNLLLHTPIQEIRDNYSTLLAEAVNRVREKEVIRRAGYDGEFGVISVFQPGEKERFAGQGDIFAEKKQRSKKQKNVRRTVKEKQVSTSVNKEKEKAEKMAANPEQTEVIFHSPGHILVQAGPGTGKTYTLIKRIGYLLTQSPESGAQTVCISFTNKAAEELQSRLKNEYGDRSSGIHASTFHSFCLHWLKKDQPQLQVVGEEERLFFLRRLFPELNQTERRRLVQDIHASLSSPVTSPANGQVRVYLDLLKKEQRVDLDGVTRKFLEDILCGPLRGEFEQTLSTLYVDEFQDLNQLQYEVIRQCARFAHIFAIGDPDQSIYGFRGSHPEFFYSFPKEFPCFRTELRRNYRSPKSVIQGAMAVIGHNPAPLPRVALTATQTASPPIQLHVSPSEKQEAHLLANMIVELIGGTSHRDIERSQRGNMQQSEYSFSDIAILYRSAKMADSLVSVLEEKALPFQIIGKRPFYMKGEVLGLYYRICCAAGSDQLSDYLQFLKQLPGIGETSLATIEKALPYDCTPLLFWDIAGEVSLKKSAKRIELLRRQLSNFTEQAQAHGITTALKECLREEKTRDEQISRFLSLASLFGTDLQAFFTYLRNNSQATLYDERAEKVTLMTIHASKGLEFPVVIIIGVEDGILPSRQSMDKEEVEEERRLFYVAMTRAKEQLILSRSVTRQVYGKKAIFDPSPFLQEIPGEFLQLCHGKKRKLKKKKSAAKQLSLF